MDKKFIKASRNTDLSNIMVEVWSAFEHHWISGQQSRHDPSKYSRVVPLHRLWLIKEGAVEFVADGKNWKIEQGEVCFLPVTQERDIITKRPASWLSLRLRITVFNKFNPMPNISFPIKWKPEEPERSQMESWMRMIARQRYLQAEQHSLIVEGLARALFGLCWPYLRAQLSNTSIHAELPAWLEQTLLRISTDLSCNVSDLAREAGYSPAQFRRSFCRYVGSTPSDYLKSQRLEATCYLLEHTDLPLSAVAGRVGVSDVSYFSRVFKAAYGMSPSAYRASLRENK